MKNKTLIALLLACSPTLAFAHNLTVGSPVPAVGVEKHGEIVLQDNNINYQKWRSADLLGKVRVIQAIAGRSSSKEMNAPLMAAITAAKFPAESYQTTTIINQDDAIWGTSSFVKSSAQDSKKSFLGHLWCLMSLVSLPSLAATSGILCDHSARQTR